MELLSGLSHRKAEVEERVGAALEAALTLPFLASLVLRALSFATQHDEVVLLGKLADVFTSKINVDACLSTKKLPSAGHKAIQNFLRETARQPSEFLFLLRLCNHVQQNSAVADQRRPLLADFEDQWTVFFSQAIPLDLRTRFATIGLQFLELSEAATRQWHHVGPPDIFS